MEPEQYSASQLPPMRQGPPRLGVWERIKKFFAPLAFILVFLGKFKGALIFLKFIPVFLKTGGSMVFMMWFYARMFGWPYAVGFVFLIFVHECGHLLVARYHGLKVGAPVFIPFVGALIMLKEQPRSAWIESQIGIGGPLLGSVGAALCIPLAYWTRNPMFLALAYSGFLINLFNLTPIGFLDGGRIVTVLSPWLWVLGLVVMLGMIAYEWPHISFILILILVLSIPRLISLFRPRTAEAMLYYQVTPQQRWTMGFIYFGLALALALGMSWVRYAN